MWISEVDMKLWFAMIIYVREILRRATLSNRSALGSVGAEARTLARVFLYINGPNWDTI